MKLAHNITVSVFCKPEEDEGQLERSLRSLFPFSLQDEKVHVSRQSAYGFNEREIVILGVMISKTTHTNAFMKGLKERLGAGQNEAISGQAETRVDEDSCFFVRLDKEALAERGECLLTDKGSCFHIRMSVAAFPKKRDNAVRLVREFFGSRS